MSIYITKSRNKNQFEVFGRPERKTFRVSLTIVPFSVVLSSLSVKSQDTNNPCLFLTEIVLKALDMAGT